MGDVGQIDPIQLGAVKASSLRRRQDGAGSTPQILACVVALAAIAPSASQAQGLPSSAAEALGRFASACGTAMVDPQAYINEIASSASNPIFPQSEDRQILWAIRDAVNGEEMVQIGVVGNLQYRACRVTYVRQPFSLDSSGVASELLAAFAVRPEVTFSGGRLPFDLAGGAADALTYGPSAGQGDLHPYQYLFIGWSPLDPLQPGVATLDGSGVEFTAYKLIGGAP